MQRDPGNAGTAQAPSEETHQEPGTENLTEAGNGTEEGPAEGEGALVD